MKTLFKLLFIVAYIGIIAGCEKEEDFFSGKETAELKKAKIKVMPCTSSDVWTKAEMDWNNINKALQNAKPGEVVQLGEGTFNLHKSIVCWDFDGTLKGSGIGKTIIRTAPGMDFDVEHCPKVEWTFEKNDGGFMLCFPHEYFEGERTVTVSGLSIIVDQPSTIYYRWKDVSNAEFNSIHGIMVMNMNLDKERDKPVNLNVSYKNLSVKGETDPKYLYGGYSLFSGLSAYGNSNGTFEVKNVSVENANGCIKPHGFMGEDARIVLKNSYLASCVFGMYSFYNHSWIIQNNSIESSKNAIVMLGRGPSPQLLWEGPDGNSFIVNNRMHFELGVGLGVQNAKNVEIKDNILEGSNLGIASMRGENFTIKDNDLCGVSPAPIFIGSLLNSVIKDNANQIILGPGASEPTILIGEGRECNVE